jgi:hypothetical protein
MATLKADQREKYPNFEWGKDGGKDGKNTLNNNSLTLKQT